MQNFIENKLTLIPYDILDILENNDFNNEAFLLSVRQELFDIRRRAMFSYLDNNIKPQWDNVISFCVSTLYKIKDLHIAIWLCEGLTKKYGFKGYIEGCIFLQHFCKNFIKNMWPKDPAAIEYCVFWINNCLTNSFMEIKVTGNLNICHCKNDQSNFSNISVKQEDLDYFAESINYIKIGQKETENLSNICLELFNNKNWEITPVKTFLQSILEMFEYILVVTKQNYDSEIEKQKKEEEKNGFNKSLEENKIKNKDVSDVDNILEILKNLPEKDKQIIFSKIHQ